MIKAISSSICKGITGCQVEMNGTGVEIMYYNECPFCGANLDPGESCDCQDSRKKKKLWIKKVNVSKRRTAQTCVKVSCQS